MMRYFLIILCSGIAAMLVRRLQGPRPGPGKIFESGSAQQIREAVAAGLDVNAALPSGGTPLSYAAAANTPEAVGALIDAGDRKSVV